MPAVNCKYHPSTPARWSCQHCQISFCPGCVTEDSARQAPACPVCKRHLQSLGSENLITPFWARLREFFIYPAYPGPLLLIMALTSISFLIGLVPAAWTVSFKLLIWRIELIYVFLFPFIVLFLNYAYNVLEDTAHGLYVTKIYRQTHRQKTTGQEYQDGHSRHTTTYSQGRLGSHVCWPSPWWRPCE